MISIGMEKLLVKTSLNMKWNWMINNEPMPMERREWTRKSSFRPLRLRSLQHSTNDDGMPSMHVDKVLHMEEGEGQFSYATNSWIQRSIISKARPILEDTIKGMCSKMRHDYLTIADLGCSSGPNAFEATWVIMNITSSEYRSQNLELPEFNVFLNDLIGNDFNTLFRLSLDFQKKLNKEARNFGPCFIFGAPGSFYGRLFPSNALHFVYASSSLHFLSEVPKGLMSKDGLPLNKGGICVTRKSPLEVYEAYRQQFAKDFMSFLSSRSREIVPDGQMVLTFRICGQNHQANYMWEFEMLGMALQTMVHEGRIEEEKFNSFNVPLYTPLVEEVKSLVEAEGSFTVNKLDTFAVDWDLKETDINLKLNERAKIFADSFRAATGPIVASHFGTALVNDLFRRFEEMAIDRFLRGGNSKFLNLVISMTKN